MLNLLKRYRELIVVTGLLLQPLWTFLAAGGKGRELNFVDRVALAISSPPQRALTWLLDGTGDRWSGYVSLRGVREENARLNEENGRLRNQVNALQEVKAENERLRTLLGYAEEHIGQEIPARILGVNPAPNVRSIRIDRGESDGVRRWMPVVTTEGVVGMVMRTAGGAADVLLISDHQAKIGVRVQRTRARATAAGGGGSAPLILENALRTEDIQEGDRIVTSGTDGVFPPGLFVGVVKGLERKNFGMFQSAQIVPAVDVTTLEEVLVLPVPMVDNSTVFAGPGDKG